MAQEPGRVLVVDDEVEISSLVAEVAGALGFEVAQAASADELRATYPRFDPSLIVLDLVMPDVDGIEVLEYLATQSSKAQILLVSGLDARVLSSAERLGRSQGLRVLGHLQKPFDLREVERILRASVQVEPARSVMPPQRESLGVEALREGIADGQLEVHYQPKATLSPTGVKSIEAVEALVRW